MAAKVREEEPQGRRQAWHEAPAGQLRGRKRGARVPKDGSPDFVQRGAAPHHWMFHAPMLTPTLALVQTLWQGVKKLTIPARMYRTVARRGVAWRGVAWRGVARGGVAWRGVASRSAPYD